MLDKKAKNMNQKKLKKEQLIQLHGIAMKMKIMGIPKDGDYEDIRENIFRRCLTGANEAFLLKAGNDFKHAAKRVLRSSLMDELRGLMTNQQAFENACVPFSSLAVEDGKGEMVEFEPADPKSMTRGYYPAQEYDWQKETIAVYNAIRAKVCKLPRKQRILARGLMLGNSVARLSKKLGVSRSTVYTMINQLRAVFGHEWAQLHALRG